MLLGYVFVIAVVVCLTIIIVNKHNRIHGD